MVCGASEENYRTPGIAPPRPCNRFDQSLPAGACSCFAAAHTSFRSVVRNAIDRRMAFAFSCRRGGIWSPPCTAKLRTRQCTVPRGVVGLSRAVGSAFGDRFIPARCPMTQQLLSVIRAVEVLLVVVGVRADL